MSHLLPPQDHPVREMFAVADLVAVSTGKVPVCCGKPQARRSALRTMEANPAVRRVALFCADPSTDELRLVSVGRRGGVRTEWTFGPMTRDTRLL
jgi:hypothetical protein